MFEKKSRQTSSCFGVSFRAPIKSKLQHPHPPGKPREFDNFLFPGGREFDLQGLPGGGDLTFAWVWWEN